MVATIVAIAATLLISIAMVFAAVSIRNRMNDGRVRPPQAQQAQTPQLTAWQQLTSFFTSHWRGGNFLPITLFLICIDVILAKDYPKLIWGPMMAQMGYVALLHVFVFLVASAFPATGVWKQRTAYTLVTLVILSFVGDVLGLTGVFGDEKIYNLVHNGWSSDGKQGDFTKPPAGGPPDLTKVRPAESFGFKTDAPFVNGNNPVNMLSLMMFFGYHASVGVITRPEANIMIGHCMTESGGGNHLGADGKPLKNGEGSSALGLCQEINHDKDYFVANPGGMNYNRADFNGNLNLALRLCLESKKQGKRCDQPWWPTDDAARKFVAQFLTEDGVPTTPITLPAATANEAPRPSTTSPVEQARNCSVTQSFTLGVDDPPTIFVVPSPDAVLETSGDGMYVIRGWYRYSNESIAITDAKSDTESQANMAGWQRKIGSFRKVEVQTVQHSADPKPVTYNVRPCQM